jgi:hypothetical protein
MFKIGVSGLDATVSDAGGKLLAAALKNGPYQAHQLKQWITVSSNPLF